MPISFEDIKALFGKEKDSGESEWMDMAGLVVAMPSFKRFFDRIKKDRVPRISEIEDGFRSLYEEYDINTWRFTLILLGERFGITDESVSLDHMLSLITRWKEDSIRMNNLILLDTKKEFDANSRIGFGLGGDEAIRDADFEQVRGNYEENSFVRGLLEENNSIEHKASGIIQKLENLK